METLYDTLKVNEDAPSEIIRAAYKALSSIHHPDKNPGDSSSSEKMKKINEAYRVLSDAQLRQQYDESLRASRYNNARQEEHPYASESSAQTTPAQQNNKKSVISTLQWWVPIIAGALSAKLLGVIGAIVLVGIYYWLLPRKGMAVASAGAIIGGVAVAAVVLSTTSIPTKSSPLPTAQAPQPYTPTAPTAQVLTPHSGEIDKFLNTPLPQQNPPQTGPSAEQIAKLDRIQPKWREKIQSPRFKIWLSQQNSNTNTIFQTTGSADEFNGLILQFDRWLVKELAAEEARRNRPPTPEEKARAAAMDRAAQALSDHYAPRPNY